MGKIRFKVLVEDLSDIKPEVIWCGKPPDYLCVHLMQAAFAPAIPC